MALGGAFFGESMFSRARDASKVALVHLVGRLIAGGFTLLDAQFLTDHLAQFGAEELARPEYRRRLVKALAVSADFYRLAPAADVARGRAGAVATLFGLEPDATGLGAAGLGAAGADGLEPGGLGEGELDRDGAGPGGVSPGVDAPCDAGAPGVSGAGAGVLQAIIQTS